MIAFLSEKLDGACPCGDDGRINGKPTSMASMPTPKGWRWYKLDGQWFLRERGFFSTGIVTRNEYISHWLAKDKGITSTPRVSAIEFLSSKLTEWPADTPLKDQAYPLCDGWWWVHFRGRIVFMSDSGYAPISKGDVFK